LGGIEASNPVSEECAPEGGVLNRALCSVVAPSLQEKYSILSACTSLNTAGIMFHYCLHLRAERAPDGR
jgi:hypothetical protein